MTCIVGVVHKKEVFMGADSASGWGSYYRLDIRKDLKIFRKGRMIMGFTTSWRMGQLLQHKLTVPNTPPSGADQNWMCTQFIDAVRECLKTGGWLRKKDEREEAGSFLAGIDGKLFEIEGDHQVAEFQQPFAAVGSGALVALGALYATRGDPPRDRIRLALKAAEAFNPGVRGPFHILSTGK